MPDPPSDPAAELAAARAEIDRLKAQHAGEATRRAIDAAITGSIDPDTARLLIERAIEPAQDKPAAIAAAARALRAAKPFLFAPSNASASGAASAPPTDEAAQAAQRARETGDRRDLIRYLRLRGGR